MFQWLIATKRMRESLIIERRVAGAESRREKENRGCPRSVVKIQEPCSLAQPHGHRRWPNRPSDLAKLGNRRRSRPEFLPAYRLFASAFSREERKLSGLNVFCCTLAVLSPTISRNVTLTVRAPTRSES